MPTPPPRHLARPRRPWRLLLFIFGLTTAILAALVASATLLPQPQPPRHAPGVALPTSPPEPAPTAASTTTATGDREPTTTTSPSTTPGPEQGAISGPATTAPTGHRPSAGQGRRDHRDGTLVLWRHHHPTLRDRATHDRQANHHRRHSHHGSAHDHAGDHDQHRVHHHQHPAHDRTDDDHPGTDDDQPDSNDDHRGVDHDGAGNDHHRTSYPRWQPTSQHLGRHRGDAPARPGGALPAARAPAAGGRQARQAAAHQPPRPPRLSHRPPDPGRQQAAKRDRRHIPRSARRTRSERVVDPVRPGWGAGRPCASCRRAPLAAG